MNVRFIADDSRLISVGGMDYCVLQWRHQKPNGQLVSTENCHAAGAFQNAAADDYSTY